MARLPRHFCFSLADMAHGNRANAEGDAIKASNSPEITQIGPTLAPYTPSL
jgi:hypothetical protein